MSRLSGSGDAPRRPTAHEPELDPPFEVLEPAALAAPLVFSSPHSGSVYPQRFLDGSRLDAMALRRSEDAFVDALFADATGLGAPLIRARFPRAYLDVNREPYELDPRMFDGRLPNFANTRSVRVAGGLGTIARVVGDAQEIYAGRLPVDEALQRIERLYKPYHAALRALLDRAHRQFGTCLLIDCHSMPSASLPALGTAATETKGKADFVIGDRYGTSCNPAFTAAADGELRRMGYVVQRNKPYAGGFITEHYGAPAENRHALQIEVNRALYMDEKSLQPNGRFADIAADLSRLAATLAEVAGGWNQAAAAE